MNVYSSKLKKNAITLKKAKIVYNFGLSECKRVKYEDEKNISDGVETSARKS